MSITRDWLPHTREDILTMARNWLAIIVANAAAWGIPAAVLTDLQALADTAEAALATAKNETTRTPVATAQCRAAFGALTGEMRDIKRRYFLVPPLTDADLIALGLKPRDTHPTPSGIPTAQVMVETYLIGRHELGVKIIYVSGSPDDPANKNYRVWYSVAAPGETPPADPEELNKSVSTRRMRDVIPFDFGDSGKTAYFAVQVENGEKKGNWGPMASAVIP